MSEVNVSNVEYNVEYTPPHKQKDLTLLEAFCNDNEHDNMCITYDNAFECKRRRANLYQWLVSKEFHITHKITITGNKLYVFKERKKK